MTGKESIIQKILSDAENFHLSQINEAKARAQEILKEAEDAKQRFYAKNQKDGEIESAALIERAETVAKLEVRKIILCAKQELISDSFALARDQILNLPLEGYKQFLSALIQKYAEEGDVVVLSKRDLSRIKEADIEQMAKGKNIRLSLSTKAGDFDGGLVLSQKNCDKNLTIDTVLNSVREKTEGKVAAILFE